MLMLLQNETRRAAFSELFGGAPTEAFSYEEFSSPDDEVRIDVLAYVVKPSGRDEMDREGIALVTCGLSDYGRPRRELLQYVPRARKADAHRLHGAAYTAAVSGLPLNYGNVVHIPQPAGTAWPAAVLLPPPLYAHSRFEVRLDGDPLRLLWHVPLAESELGYQRAHGIPALLWGLSEARHPWIFEESTRPVLAA